MDALHVVAHNYIDLSEGEFSSQKFLGENFWTRLTTN